MARKISKESRRKITEQLERDEEAKKAQRKAMEERELKKLTRQARMIKEAKLGDVVTEKQAKVKKILLNEKASLEDSLKVMNTAQRCLSDSKQAQEISNLFAQRDDLDAAIAQEKKYIEELDCQIHNDLQNIQTMKKRRGFTALSGEYLQRKDSERAGRSLEAWTSRLAVEQTQLAMAIKENEEMRNKLQRLIREKGLFNKLHSELMGKLTRGKGVMADVVERSRQNFQKRDEVLRKIEALRNRDKVDLAKRMEEMQDLEITLNEDKRLNSFRQRVQAMRERILEEGRPSKESVEQRQLTLRLERVNEFWASLQEAAGLISCEEICKHIVTEDTKLFSLFNFNIEIRDQMEVLTYKTAELVSTVNEESMAAEDVLEENIRNNKQKTGRLELMEHDLSDLKDYYDANTRVFGRLLEKIKGLCDLMQCHPSVFKDLLGQNTEVTQHNYQLFLRLVENEVISALSLLSPHHPTMLRAYTTLSRFQTTTESLFLSRVEERSTVPVKRVLTHNCFQ